MSSVDVWDLKEQRCSRKSRHRKARSLYRLEREVWRSVRVRVLNTEKVSEQTETNSLGRAKRLLFLKARHHARKKRAKHIQHLHIRDDTPVTWNPPDPITLPDPPEETTRPYFFHAIPPHLNCCAPCGVFTEFYTRGLSGAPYAFCGVSDLTKFNLKLGGLLHQSRGHGYDNPYWIRVAALVAVMSTQHAKFKTLWKGFQKRSQSLKRLSEDLVRYCPDIFPPLDPRLSLRTVMKVLERPTQIYGCPQTKLIFCNMYRGMVSYSPALFLFEHGAYFLGVSRAMRTLARKLIRLAARFPLEVGR
eukprot:Blabericola_migrator_1__9247@NODE_496_length_8026_cov_206_953889_g380_i0_p2_GENE_NODE_496_length_8026_cov_206_953889_g380_i0NODE_496_length_8026_cov_206_953889_g380_i0_p2_ORF_typecomplete_len303_score23_40_NODE_496_length_8026_cov_206_953889_g380_i021933101